MDSFFLTINIVEEKNKAGFFVKILFCKHHKSNIFLGLSFLEGEWGGGGHFCQGGEFGGAQKFFCMQKST